MSTAFKTIIVRQGSVGPRGADGATILSGIGAPANSLGDNGDYYLDTATGDFYGPKALGVWPSPPLELVVTTNDNNIDGGTASTIYGGSLNVDGGNASSF